MSETSVFWLMWIMERQRCLFFILFISSLADGLISSNGIISTRLAGEIPIYGQLVMDLLEYKMN